MGKTFVMGDIHGAHKALLQCLERSNFNRKEDTLIQLGDIVDGWGQSYECVEELLKIKNLIAIKGNHDDWWMEYINCGVHPVRFLHGGHTTFESYKGRCQEDNGFGENSIYIPEDHQKFFRTQHLYYKDDKNRLFVHGGFNRHKLLSEHKDEYVFYWDRDLWHTALSYEAMKKGLVYHYELEEDEKVANEKNVYNFKIKEPLTEIFIGHTTTGLWHKDVPMQAGPIWNLDTGAGFEGKLTIMDVDTHEYWQSDRSKELYPGQFGRTR